MMKRWLLFLALAGGMQVASAAGRAGEILEGLAAGFRAMKGYEVDFAVEAGEYRTAGSYAVEGQGYFLTLVMPRSSATVRSATRWTMPAAR